MIAGAAADGNLYLLGKQDTVGMAVASAAACTEKGRFSHDDQGLPSWAHPVVCNSKLYIRNQGVLASYDIKAE
jgi:hypothetical protein